MMEEMKMENEKGNGLLIVFIALLVGGLIISIVMGLFSFRFD